MQQVSFVFLFQIITTIHGSIQLAHIRSAAYVHNNLTNVDLYNGTCSACVCYAFISNQSSIYQGLNCFTNNNTCQLFRDLLSRSSIRIDANSELFLRSLPTNSTQNNCTVDYSQCSGVAWNGIANCCTASSSCVYVNQSYSWCLPVTSSPSTALSTARLTTGLADDITRQDGKSGTYWGCCKPSCGWPYKAPVTNPAKTCHQDGVTGIDVNTASVCDSGSSHMCTDQQPWNVSDRLSYAYGGVNILGQGEWNWCCSCYSLVFTSGLIASKEIILQAVNTAYSSHNMFVLHIPGGGWLGTANGCASQFSSSFTWGQYDGGVSNRSQCANLPSVLQPGCYWRFDWLMNVVNPDVRFKQVSCPSVLTNITGCIRT